LEVVEADEPVAKMLLDVELSIDDLNQDIESLNF
jgi:hypothetical protein